MSLLRAVELCESPGGRPGFPVPDSPYGLYACKATFQEEEWAGFIALELCEGRGGRPGFPVPDNPYGLYVGRSSQIFKSKQCNPLICDIKEGHKASTQTKFH